MSRSIFLSFLFATGVANASAGTSNVWFVPHDPGTDINGQLGPTVPDYMNLFEGGASEWSIASAKTNVFKIYPSWINGASDQNLQIQFSWLNQHGISLALEYGPITTASSCQAGVGINTEGSGGQTLAAMAERIKTNGGILKFLAMDEPVFNTVGSSCAWTVEQVVQNIKVNVSAMRTVFPELQVGDIEPIGSGETVGGSSTTFIDGYYQKFIETFQSQIGPLAFFHADVAWTTPGILQVIGNTQAMVRSLGVPFGIIYDPIGNETTDAESIQSMVTNMQNSELANGQPDMAVIQNWYTHPTQLIPETSPSSMTYVIDQYVRPRSAITYALNVLYSSQLTLSGQLTSNGVPLPGQTIAVSNPSIPGTLNGFVYQGAIPAGTTRAVFGIRVNTECGGCEGVADFQAQYFKFQSDNNPVVEQRFNATGITSWLNPAHYHPGLTPLANGNLMVNAQAGQIVTLTGGSFPVSGNNFTFSVGAEVFPDNVNSGEFILVFLGANGEISRARIPIQTAPNTIGIATTDALGNWSLQLPAAAVQAPLQMKFYGTAGVWPTIATMANPPGLYAVVGGNTATNMTEVHQLSGQDLFQSMLLETATGISLNPGTFDYELVDWDHDGIPDLAIIIRSGTQSGKTEVHILSGASNYKTFILHTTTMLEPTDANWQFQFVDWDHDGVPDLVAINKGKTASGFTEVNVLSGASGVPKSAGSAFQSSLVHAPTVYAEYGTNANADFHIIDWNHDGTPDLVLVLSGVTGSGYREVHVLSGAGGSFQARLLDIVTPLPLNDDVYQFQLTDWDGDGIPDLVAIKQSDVASDKTEVHILSGASNFSTFILHSTTMLPPTGSNFKFLAPRSPTL